MGSYARGFTIIEVILFLAISGLLLAGALAGMTTNINNSRFNDAIRSTTSYIQRQYSELETGVSNRPDSLSCDVTGVSGSGATRSPGMTDCVILGRFIKIEGTQLTTRYITGYRASLSGLSADDTLAIQSMQPKVAGTNTFAQDYDVPWGMHVVDTKIASGVYPAATGFAIIRSPASGNIVYYSFSVGAGVAEPNNIGTLISSTNINKNVDVCIADDGNDRYGHITIEAGQGQEVIQTNLTSAPGACW